MANKDRQKRSARKARAAERKALEEQHAVSNNDASKKARPAKAKAEKASAKAPAKKAEAKKKGRIATWFGDVRTEMHRVTWPTRTELRNYAMAVIVMLVVFGVAIWLVDTGVVAALVGYSGLRG